MNLLRIYLLAGLVAHKAVWELLKRRGQSPAAAARPNRSLRLLLVKTVKIGILIGLVLQTFLPDVFPIAQESALLRSAGIAIYTAGLLTAIIARVQLDRNWSDIENAQILSDQTIISHGLYGYIRHPIYVGDLLLLFGFELSLNSWLVLCVALLTPVILWQATREEEKLATSLPGYDHYRRSTKRFIPFVI